MASVVCASREIEPNDIAPVAKRRTMLFGVLDLFERHRLAAVFFRALDAEQAADGDELLGLLVQHLGEFAVALIGIAAHGMLQGGDRRRVPGMILAAGAELILAADIERGLVNRRIAEGVAMAA